MMNKMEVTDIVYDLAEQLKTLHDKKKEAEQRVKDINAALDDVEYRLATIMADTETQNFTRAGTMFSLTHKARASATTNWLPHAPPAEVQEFQRRVHAHYAREETRKTPVR